MHCRVINGAGALGILGGIVVCGAISAPAAAQSPEEVEAIRRCSEIEDTAERYRCYDEVMRTQPRAPERRALPVPGSAPAPEVQRNRGASASAPASAAVNTAPGNPASRFGLKSPPPGEPAAIDVLIVDTKKSVTGKWMFTTADGQLWVQSDTKRAIYHQERFNAKIKKGMIGGFFLNPEGPDMTVRVRRVK